MMKAVMFVAISFSGVSESTYTIPGYESLGKLRTSCPSAGNGRLGHAEKPDFHPLIIG